MKKKKLTADVHKINDKICPRVSVSNGKKKKKKQVWEDTVGRHRQALGRSNMDLPDFLETVIYTR